MSLLEIRDLRVAFPGRGFRPKPVEVLHGIDLDVAAGETVGLVGESGSGKTTIGRAVLGLVRPSAGTIRFDGQEIGVCAAPPAARSPTRSKSSFRIRTPR